MLWLKNIRNKNYAPVVFGSRIEVLTEWAQSERPKEPVVGSFEVDKTGEITIYPYRMPLLACHHFEVQHG